MNSRRNPKEQLHLENCKV